MTLTELATQGLLDPLDVRFAGAMGRLAETDDAQVLLGAALASRAVSEGDVGVDLRAKAELVADAEGWAAALAAVPQLVRRPDEDRPAPLVLDGTDLYLERTWGYQERLARLLRRRLSAPTRRVDMGRLVGLLGRLSFDDPRAALQKRAAVTACHRGLSLIAGGPGTGKTAVVVKLLALLQALEGQPRSLRVRLAAPTGKAAARMSESIRATAEAWLDADLRPGEVVASTIHRLLGWRGPHRFEHDRENPLPVDLLIVDEASMIPLPLMTKLLEAVPEGARVLLLGDPDQLASVEVGSVFADLCRVCAGPVSRELCSAWSAAGVDVTGVAVTEGVASADALTVLTHTWRYAAGSGIEALARSINAGDPERSLEVLGDDAYPDVRLVTVPGLASGVLARVEGEVLSSFLGVAQARSPVDALEALRSVRVLGAHRGGRIGVTALNDRLEARVRQRLSIPEDVDWFHGRPVMITRNDNEMRLYNGDVGVVASGSEGLRVWFETADRGRPREIPPAMLPEHDTVFATSVHKSQGSEYAHVVLVLPGDASALLTRDLLYTAVTRASKRVTVYARPEVWTLGVRSRVERMSRLEVQCSRGVDGSSAAHR